MNRRYARGEGGALRVIETGEHEREITHRELMRQKRSLIAQLDREQIRLRAEIADVNDMLEACVAMGAMGPGGSSIRDPKPDEAEAAPIVPSLGKRVWAALTKPRGIGQ